MSVINTGESVFTRREPRTSHELQEIFRLNRYRSDIERGMLVKLSLPPLLNQNASVQQSIDMQVHTDFIRSRAMALTKNQSRPRDHLHTTEAIRHKLEIRSNRLQKLIPSKNCDYQDNESKKCTLLCK